MSTGRRRSDPVPAARTAAMRQNPLMAPSGRPASAAGGLRERKKRKTRAAIQREAMRLFQEQGYDATTIEQIADAVEISPSTFFNYFPTKEDVVMGDDYDPLVAARLAARPAEEPLGVAIRRLVREGMAGIFQRDRDVMLARGRLALEVPALRARMWEEMERAQGFIRMLIAQRLRADPDDFELRVAAGAVASGIFAAAMEWARLEGRVDIADLMDRALDVVESGARLDKVAGPGRASDPPRQE